MRSKDSDGLDDQGSGVSAVDRKALQSGECGLDDRLVWTADALSRGAGVVWGYYTQGLRYVSRALIACPRGDGPCPYGS